MADQDLGTLKGDCDIGGSAREMRERPAPRRGSTKTGM
jgi:hypothetical protein